MRVFETVSFLGVDPASKACVTNVGEGFFWFPSALPFVSRGAKIAFFLNGRFVTNFDRLPLRRCVSLRFHVFFGNLELTGTKKGFPNDEIIQLRGVPLLANFRIVSRNFSNAFQAFPLLV